MTLTGVFVDSVLGCLSLGLLVRSFNEDTIIISFFNFSDELDRIKGVLTEGALDTGFKSRGLGLVQEGSILAVFRALSLNGSLDSTM